jgi:hypothetical protein
MPKKTKTYAYGGNLLLDDPDSNSRVNVNKWVAHTDLSIYPKLAAAGLLGQGADSVTMDQWKTLPANEKIKRLGPNLGTDGQFDFTKGNTGNADSIKYWEKTSVPSPDGKSLRKSKVLKDSFTSADYFREKNNSAKILPEYGFGSWLKQNGAGLLKGASSLVSAIPGIGQIAGPILSVAGSTIESVQKNKADQGMANAQQSQIDAKAAGDAKLAYDSNLQTRNQNLFSGKDINYGGTFAMGGDLMPMKDNGQLNIVKLPKNADKHSEGIGGVPVDIKGNPTSMSHSSVVGMVEGGELMYNGFVFSNNKKMKLKKNGNTYTS